MKALRLKGANDFSVEETERPQIGEREILVKVKSTAICGTDIRILEGKKTKDVRYPSTIGHEISGKVCEVGTDISSFKIGDRVAIANVVCCHECTACKSGHENVCMNRIALGYEYDGGFAEYIRIPEIFINNDNILKMPDSMSYDEGALVEPTACCTRGQKNAGISKGQKILIVGAGPIGLIHVLLAKAKGVDIVMISEPSEKRCQIAKSFGTDYVFPGIDERVKQEIMDTTNGVGCDTVLMAAGIPTIVNDVLDVCRKGGTLNLFAGFPKGILSEIDVNKIHYGEIRVNGSSAYKLEDYIESFNLIATKKVDISKLVTNRFKLNDFKNAYDLCKEGDGLKIIINP